MTKKAVIAIMSALTVNHSAQNELAKGRGNEALGIIFNSYGDQLSDLDDRDLQAVGEAFTVGTTEIEVAQHLNPYLKERYQG